MSKTETIEEKTYRIMVDLHKFTGSVPTLEESLKDSIFLTVRDALELAIAEEREACNKSGVNIDECIDLSAALERQRALKIIEAVMSARIGGAESTMPTPFQAGYQLACDESIFRIKNEEWELRLPTTTQKDEVS